MLNSTIQKIGCAMLATTLVFSLGGCATVLTSSESKVNIQVVDSDNNKLLTDLQCSVSDRDGIVYRLPNNPGQITVPKGQGTLKVECYKAGYLQQNMGIAQQINGVTLVNVIFWPGFIIDAASGKMQKYPSKVTIQMKKSKD